MPRKKRHVVAPDGVSVVLHCYTRCVRRAFLCGVDQETQTSYEHRKQWIRDRLEFLASVFAIDIMGFAVMDNHFHLICRTRHDISDPWTDEEIARRWYRLFPKRAAVGGKIPEPTKAELDEIMTHRSEGDPAKRIAELRRRLQNVSWLMKALCENIAKRANKEDKVTGAFWEGRFKTQKLLDNEAILACSVYVDLNPVRANMAATPEESHFTSAYERIATRQAKQEQARNSRTGKGRVKAKKKSKRVVQSSVMNHHRDRFLSPLTLPLSYEKDSSGKKDSTMACKHRHRASNKGFLRMTLDKYLELLDWTGRQIRMDKSGSIPAGLAPILERLQMSGQTWVDCVKNFGRWFGWAVGKEQALVEERDRSGLHRMQSRPQTTAIFG